MSRKITVAFIAILLSLCLTGLVYATEVDNTENSVPDIALFKGAGTVDAPYEIATATDFAVLAEQVNAGNTEYSDAHYKVVNSIDFEGVSYTPVGTYDNPFTGVFDGGKYILSNLTITGEYLYAGLFGVTINADVQNVVLKNLNIDISVVDNVVLAGGICGYNSVEFTTDTHFYKNCSVEGTIKLVAGTLNSRTSSTTAGGIIGKSETHNNGKFVISNCNVDADITVTSEFSAFAGGILGVTKSAHTGGSNITTVTGCVVTGEISASANNGSWADAGGIASWFSQQTLGWSDEYKEDAALAAFLASIPYINMENCVSDCVVSSVVKNDKQGNMGVMCGEISGDFINGANAINKDNALQESESGYNGEPVETEILFTETYLSENFGFDFENVWEFVLSRPVLKTAAPYIATEYNEESSVLRVAPVNCGECDVYAIAYTSEGRVAASRRVPYNGSDAEVNPDFSGVEFDYIRVFVLDADLKPLCVPVNS